MENFNSLQIQSNLTIRLTTGTRQEPHLFRQHKAVLAVQQWLVTEQLGKLSRAAFWREGWISVNSFGHDKPMQQQHNYPPSKDNEEGTLLYSYDAIKNK